MYKNKKAHYIKVKKIINNALNKCLKNDRMISIVNTLVNVKLSPLIRILCEANETFVWVIKF